MIKTCSCGRSYTIAEFKALPSLGRQPVGEDESYVLVNCVDCSSTMALDARLVDADVQASGVYPSSFPLEGSWLDEEDQDTTPFVRAEVRAAG